MVRAHMRQQHEEDFGLCAIVDNYLIASFPQQTHTDECLTLRHVVSRRTLKTQGFSDFWIYQSDYRLRLDAKSEEMNQKKISNVWPDFRYWLKFFRNQILNNERAEPSTPLIIRRIKYLFVFLGVCNSSEFQFFFIEFIHDWGHEEVELYEKKIELGRQKGKHSTLGKKWKSFLMNGDDGVRLFARR